MIAGCEYSEAGSMGDLVGDQGVQVQVAALHTWRVGLLRTITTPLKNSSLQK